MNHDALIMINGINYIIKMILFFVFLIIILSISKLIHFFLLKIFNENLKNH